MRSSSTPSRAAAHTGPLEHGGDRMQMVVAPPVGIDDVVTEAAPPRLACVDIRRNGGVAVLGDREAIGPAECGV
ncbi:hypothetical protein PA7_34620 [Pseudonocardia asaccharolytica DSM 44247 = NBRC 16224]|uniref:Uncharacterized protein n=1 Tax=Pseudonocardia asaccharolytica DSM 44247 = NBRC 16224 TaxID=1123024 RepID=A0A511D4C6_9PSEU|nr:hypothetical protein PA7_34620 [Pseudonocardia asaccharolytica DSM 44247 = NBRC 16224]